jgi:hypothetical protein
MDGPAQPSHSHAAAPLWAVNVFSFLSSFGTGIVTYGISLIAKQAYGFTQFDNYLMAVVIGFTYIVGSLGAGPLVRALRVRFPNLSDRAVLVWLMGLMAILCLIPWGTKAAAIESAWPLWVLVTLYSPLTGILWPVVESFVSGGRSGPTLLRSLGIWNIVWSSAVVLASWGMGPALERHAVAALAVLGVMHISSCIVLIPFPRLAPRHETEAHQANLPPVYPDLLATFRIILPVSYVISSALGPFLPSAMETLRIPIAWQPIVLSAWQLPRMIGFIVHQATTSWRGTWAHPISGGIMLLVGFVAAILAPRFAGSADGNLMGMWLLIGGLTIFGAGMSCIYSGAIYYAMSVGNAEVDAGGMHEALIGVGYTIGPMIGLVPTLLIDRNVVAASTFEPTVLVATGVVATVGIVLVTRAVARQHAS